MPAPVCVVTPFTCATFTLWFAVKAPIVFEPVGSEPVTCTAFVVPGVVWSIETLPMTFVPAGRAALTWTPLVVPGVVA